jgi:hypothetical protein
MPQAYGDHVAATVVKCATFSGPRATGADRAEANVRSESPEFASPKQDRGACLSAAADQSFRKVTPHCHF